MSDSHRPAVFRPVIRERDPGIHLDRSALPWRNGLVVRATNWLGDTLMTLPALHKLSVLVPEPCGFFVACPAKLAPVWRAAEWVSDVIPMRGRRLDPEGRRHLQRLKPGVGVVLPNSFGSALDLWRSRIPIRVGRAGRLRSALLTHRLAEWPRGENTGLCHQLSYYLELVSAFGYVPWNAECPPLQVPDAENVAQRFGIPPHVRTQWLALAPGAAYGPAKQWPVEHFAEVADWWRGQGGQVVIVGAPNERDAAAAIARRVPGVLNLTGYTKLDDLMAVLKSVDAVVANDSGAMHLAAALGTPGVALFGSTDPISTGPIGSRWIVVQERLECSPCFRRTCPLQSDTCMCLERIAPARVCAAVTALLGPDKRR